MPHPYSHFIHLVAKPARYLGGELNSVVKDHTQIGARLCLAFPDVYEIGMSHMGTKILYKILNAHDDLYAERCFTPWVDMEKELRDRQLPLVSLETSSPLKEFDVIGMSLQYELSYTNCLTMLDLAGIPLRSSERDQSHPLILAGGPNATHPEPVAEFFDAFFIGEAEEQLPDLVRTWSRLRSEGVPRREALIQLASAFAVYVPSLYEVEVDEDTAMHVVGQPVDARVPKRVRRAFLEDLDRFPFPTDGPVPYAEAVFDRAGVEIARGCTEGCRFCQAGMIYRPVRERSPESIVESVLSGVDKSGYDETSLTSLSTADYSCITPLVRKVMGELRERKVSLSVSSLRAYGLGDEILDEMASMRVTGLTFAPEAGTQRMRDVVNKNVTEAHIEESTRRVFARGWKRLKLYFMIGLPTEQDDDVVGIVDTGERMLGIGRSSVGNRAEVTVSVSSHVPKPHTPFQWCAQDSITEIARKQSLLRKTLRQRRLRLKYHDRGISFVEGVFSRGDRRLADAIELAWKRGARFDGWDELFDVDRWRQAFEDSGVDVDSYLGTRPVSARLPWDHLDVGLEDGFLLREYRRALADRLSPPCGKMKGQLVHAANLEESEAESKRLVCYDCGVACDLDLMRQERRVKLVNLGAKRPHPKAEPVRIATHKPRPAFEEREFTRFRLRYSKLDRAAFLGHLDSARVLMRLFRRADIEVAYSRGFHPKPRLHYAPALSLGVQGLAELLDVDIEGRWNADSLLKRLQESESPGFHFSGAWQLGGRDSSLAKLIRYYDLAIMPRAPQANGLGVSVEDLRGRAEVPVQRKKRQINLMDFVESLELVPGTEALDVRRVLDWPGTPFAYARIRVGPDGSVKPIEVAEALGLEEASLVRLGFPGVISNPAGVNLEPVAVSDVAQSAPMN